MKNLIAKREKQQQSKTQRHTVILKTSLSVNSRGLLFSLILMKFPSLVTVIPSPLPNNHHETNTWAYTHAITYFFDDLLTGSSFCLHDCSLKREDTWPTFFYFTHFIFTFSLQWSPPPPYSSPSRLLNLFCCDVQVLVSFLTWWTDSIFSTLFLPFTLQIYPWIFFTSLNSSKESIK